MTDPALPLKQLKREHEYLVGIDWKLLPVPGEQTLRKVHSLIAPKDLHVLSAAIEGGSEFLLTLDRKHVLAAAEAVQEAGLAICILRPGDFIQQYYPLHAEYVSRSRSRN